MKQANRRKSIYEINYRLLTRLCPKLKHLLESDNIILHSGNLMPLSINLISEDNSSRELSLAHLKSKNGDLIPDPEIILNLYLDDKYIEVISYQNEFGFISVKNGKGDVYIDERNCLNAFLKNWLLCLTRERYQEKV